MTNPKKQNYFMPAEWYPHECCWMQWPHEFQNKNSYQEVESWSHFDFFKFFDDSFRGDVFYTSTHSCFAKPS